MNTNNDSKKIRLITQECHQHFFSSPTPCHRNLVVTIFVENNIGILQVKYNKIDFDQETLFNMKNDPFEIKNLMEEPTKFHLKLVRDPHNFRSLIGVFKTNKNPIKSK